jgi:hypothetical protein
MSLHYGPKNGATHNVPALPSLRGAPAAQSVVLAGRERRRYMIPQVGAGSDSCGDAQLDGLARERRVGESVRSALTTREIERGVLAELNERERLRVCSRLRGSRAERARPQRRT